MGRSALPRPWLRDRPPFALPADRRARERGLAHGPEAEGGRAARIDRLRPRPAPPGTAGAAGPRAARRRPPLRAPPTPPRRHPRRDRCLVVVAAGGGDDRRPLRGH